MRVASNDVFKSTTLKMVIFGLSFILSVASMAKAPLSEEGPGKGKNGVSTKRHPAQVQGMQIAKPLDQYLDMDCQQLVNKNSKDEFIRYFTREVSLLNENFCSIVGESFQTEGDDMAQSERRMIGMGTFSKLLESHYNEFVYDKRLEYYQDLDCHNMMNRNSDDAFIRFFAQQMMEINENLCDSMVGAGTDQSRYGEEQDFAQADRPIGQGTWSKIIEESYHEFNYRQ